MHDPLAYPPLSTLPDMLAPPFIFASPNAPPLTASQPPPAKHALSPLLTVYPTHRSFWLPMPTPSCFPPQFTPVLLTQPITPLMRASFPCTSPPLHITPSPPGWRSCSSPGRSTPLRGTSSGAVGREPARMVERAHVCQEKSLDGGGGSTPLKETISGAMGRDLK